MLDLDLYSEGALHLAQQWVIKDITVLLTLLPAHVRPELSRREQARLTDYAVSTRYPGDYEPLSLEEAQEAVAVASRVRNQIRRRLPKAVTQSKGD